MSYFKSHPFGLATMTDELWENIEINAFVRDISLSSGYRLADLYIDSRGLSTEFSARHRERVSISTMQHQRSFSTSVCGASYQTAVLNEDFSTATRDSLRCAITTRQNGALRPSYYIRNLAFRYTIYCFVPKWDVPKRKNQMVLYLQTDADKNVSVWYGDDQAALNYRPYNIKSGSTKWSKYIVVFNFCNKKTI
jgi:hypothetical protein